MSEWQPIESAPTGIFVDVFARGQRCTDARFNVQKQRWEHWWIDDFGSLGWVKVDGKPTHWMPAPKDPDDAEKHL